MKNHLKRVVQQYSKKKAIRSPSFGYIDLSEARLKEVPQEVLMLRPKGLWLCENPGIKVPQAVMVDSAMNMLTYLNMSRCNLLNLPKKSFESMTSLIELILSHNSLSSIPIIPQSIQKLDVSHNMLMTVPDHFQSLPSLYDLRLDGNPCAFNRREPRGRKTVEIMGKSVTIDNCRFDQEELHFLVHKYLSISGRKGLDTITFKTRFKLNGCQDTAFIDSMYQLFLRRSSKNDIVDLRGFLLVMGVLFKGTVEERLDILFELYDLGENGFIKLSDFLRVTKSCLASSVYMAEMYRNQADGGEHFTVNTVQLEVQLQPNERTQIPSRVDVGSALDMVNKVLELQWNSLKTMATKKYKEMDIVRKGKVDRKHFNRYFYLHFDDVIAFLEFYGSLLRN
jgi:Ca2+-binding EF-hand superfamily protein